MKRRTEPRAEDRLPAMLQPGGKLARLLPGFEPRPGQLQMLTAVGRAFATESLLAVEAGTGVGKSLAYGLPAADFALRQEERVVVSSATINLQQQLVGKDFPLVTEALGGGLKVALAKGRGNYLCRRRLEELCARQTLIETDASVEQIRELVSWAERTEDGSLGEMDFPLDHDLQEAVASDSDACPGRRCPFRRECFFLAARRLAARADLLVVNHHLLCADLALRARQEERPRGVLPPFSRLVIDEAHELEDAASSFFGVRLSAFRIRRLFARIVGRRGGGLLKGLADEIAGGEDALADGRADIVRASFRHIHSRAQEAGSAWGEAFAQLGGLVRGAIPAEGRLRLDERLRQGEHWPPLCSAFQHAADITLDLAEEVERLCGRLSLIREEDSLAVETLAWCARGPGAGRADRSGRRRR